MAKMIETTPGRAARANSNGKIRLDEQDKPKDYSLPSSAIAPSSPAEMEEKEEDLEEIGETVLHLSGGKLTIEEPSYETIRDCRIYCARWAADNEDIAKADPGIVELEYIAYLCCHCTIAWEPKAGAKQKDLNKLQFEQFSASDFRKVTRLMRKYAGNLGS
jgi:hypothetical protein